MSVIVVFDSGFGSLSIIKAIQKNTKANIVYFADQKNFPYGKKSKSELEKIIRNTISNLKAKFHGKISAIFPANSSMIPIYLINRNRTLLIIRISSISPDQYYLYFCIGCF